MSETPLEFDLAVAYATPRAGLPAAVSFRRWVAAALRGRVKKASLALRLVDEEEGQALNRHYRGGDHATNVLSFAAELPPGLPPELTPMLGDLVICVPVVRHEARAQCKLLHAHFAHMTVHGVLHLLGYDHQTDAEAETMEALETQILAELGMADPYADSDL